MRLHLFGFSFINAGSNIELNLTKAQIFGTNNSLKLFEYLTLSINVLAMTTQAQFSNAIRYVENTKAVRFRQHGRLSRFFSYQVQMASW